MVFAAEIDRLAAGDDPSLRYLVRRDVLDEDPAGSAMRRLLPMRGLAALGDRPVEVDRASAFLLEREVVFRRSTGAPLHPVVVQLHFPAYWHYDLLAGLTALVDGGRVTDERCGRALDLLESLRLPEGGWPAHAKVVPGGR